MSESNIATKTVVVGVQAVNIVSHLSRGYTLYIDISGSSHKVLRPLSAPNALIVRRTPSAGVNKDWGIVVVTDDDKDLEQLCIYGVKSTPAPASELAPGKLLA